MAKARSSKTNRKSPKPVDFTNPSKVTTQKAKSQEADVACFFMASALAIYERDDEIKQRNLNVLLQSSTPSITKDDLQTLNRTVMQRLNAESDVQPDQIKDVIFMSISFLGAMPPEEFHGQSADKVDEAAGSPA